VVNQWQLLALGRRQDVHLSVIDAPFFSPHWIAETGAFGPAETAALSALGPAVDAVDVEYRISVPFDLAPANVPVALFGVTESWALPPGRFIGGTVEQIARRDDLRVIVPSRWARDGFVSNGVPAERIATVPHGVDLATFRFTEASRAEVRRMLGLEGFVFLNVGAMVPNKGVDLLMEAFANVLERGHKATLLLKGHDMLYGSASRLQDLLKRLTPKRSRLVLANLKYVGQQLDMGRMAKLYAAADAYVSPYLAEGFNMPVLEAAAVGLPVIATAGGPTDDFTTDAFNRRIEARLVRNANKAELRPDVDHLTELMARMVEDSEFVAQARAAGPHHAAMHFTWDKVVDRLVAELRGML